MQNNFIQNHIQQILKHIDAESIRARKFKVAVDMTNGAGCVMTPELFKELGIELVPLNNIPSGKFTHKPEPLKENLGEIEALVKKENCDLGFAQDPDADRLVVINENGEMISEEYTVALGMEAILCKDNAENKIIVVNMSTSQMNTDIATKYRAKCVRSKVGEANVVGEMLKNNAIAGGEGGGGVIYPTINFARDSFVSMALVLELLAGRNQTVTEVIASLPKYYMKKDKVNVNGELKEIYSKLKEHFSGGIVNELDGLRLDFPDSSWVHIRPSNTEPIIRLYGEAKNEERISSLFVEVKNLLS